MNEKKEPNTEKLQQQIDFLSRRSDNMENHALPPDRVVWLLATQYILGTMGIVGGITVGLTWAFSGLTEAISLAEQQIHIAMACLMVVGAITLITKGWMEITSRL